MSEALTHAATSVVIGGRAILIEGPPGSGKSSLALALIDRGAKFVGDDAVTLTRAGDRLLASPHPTIAGKLEIRNLGLVEIAAVDLQPVALVLRLDLEAPRFVEAAEDCWLLDVRLPMLSLWPDSPLLAIKAEWALARFGI